MDNLILTQPIPGTKKVKLSRWPNVQVGSKKKLSSACLLIGSFMLTIEEDFTIGPQDKGRLNFATR